MKLTELANIEITFLKGGYENYKSPYDSPEFLVGRCEDFKQPPTADGNFQKCKPKKGVPKDQWPWETVGYNRREWTTSYSYLVKHPEGEDWVELTWKQNENLKLQAELTDWGKVKFPVSATPKIVDKTVEFKLSQAATADDFKDIEPVLEDLPF